MHPNEIRASFLDYFARHGHRLVPSSPLVPADDPTLLFTNAGMNQFKDVFLGRESRDYLRAATSQKCMRVSGKHNDLDTVGPSLRHHTFFEMLGNFSFGDYFKADAIPLAWRLLTEEWKIEPSRLVATIFKGEAGIPRDDEAFAIWRRVLPPSQIGELGMSDNFWAMGDTGPCGRCSEIYYDRGRSVAGTGDFMTDVASGSDRFVEIWNNVFMEFARDEAGTLHDLPARSIDTGMGLERISAVLIGSLSNYDTELFSPILRELGRLSGLTYRGTMDPPDVSMRVVADHIRATTFLIADGVVPSNEWRGYVLRKIMRRAMRHGRKLGLAEPFLSSLVPVLVAEMGSAYPEITGGQDAIIQVVRNEEERFGIVLTEGLPRLEDVLERAAGGDRVVPGDQAFRLYDTYGLPRDFIEDLASAQGLRFDADGFDRAMEAQRQRARAGSAFDGRARDAFAFTSDATRQVLSRVPDTFDGYTETRLTDVPVMAVFNAHKQQVDALAAGDRGYLVLERTPFYLEAGGQVSDQGRIIGTGGEAHVTDVSRLGGGLPRVHAIDVLTGTLRIGDRVAAEIDTVRRDATRRNHTATHLLHATLRHVLGPHVKQAGSLVAPDRLRFDFVHFSALSPEEIARIERIVNEHVLANTAVGTATRDTQEAIAAGAMALFGEKYGDRVRVVSIPEPAPGAAGTAFSVELCGGTHVRATGDIGAFFITEEGGVAAGVRRLEAVTGLVAYEYGRRRLDLLHAAVALLNTTPDGLVDAISTHLQAESRLRKDVQQLKTKLALGGGKGTAANDRVEIAGSTLIARRVDDMDRASLRSLADSLKSTITSGVVLLASAAADGRVSIVASVTPDLTMRAPAGELVKQLAPLVGGRGGGRPDFAEAGGKDAAKVETLLREGHDLIKRLLAVH